MPKRRVSSAIQVRANLAPRWQFNFPRLQLKPTGSNRHPIGFQSHNLFRFLDSQFELSVGPPMRAFRALLFQGVAGTAYEKRRGLSPSVSLTVQG